MRQLQRNDKIILVVIAASVAFCVATVAVIHTERLTYNWTPCVPVGIYQDIAIKKPLYDGEWVTLCPPITPSVRQEIRHHWLLRSRRSVCADHLMPFIKHVAAVPGQTVNLSAAGIAVDGRLIAHTIIQQTAPVPMNSVHLIHYPFGTYTVKPGTFWEYANNNKWAFDSRYYGPILYKNIRSGARPVWIFEGKNTGGKKG
jgi:conjugative transfer signal peptidase TraF